MSVHALSLVTHTDRAPSLPISRLLARSCPSRLAESPQYRLPALYLLDSISKNIGYPYPVLWAPHVYRIFMDTYRIVDATIKAKLENLLATWRDSGADGAPLFGADAQASIENSLFGSAKSPPPQPRAGSAPLRGTPPLGNGAPGAVPGPGSVAPPPAARLRGVAHGIIGRIEASLRRLPPAAPNEETDVAIRRQALLGLQQVVQSGQLGGDELARIDQELKTLEPPALHAKSEPVAAPAPAFGQAPGLPMNLLSALSGVSAPSGPAAAGAGSADDLFSKLMSSGLLSSLAKPAPPAQDDAYAQEIMSIDIKLTVMDLQREPRDLEFLVRRHLPVQCRQCSQRFPAGQDAKESVDAHLDWHFRQNKRAKDSVSRGQSRQWLPRLEEFVRGGFDDSPPKVGAEHKEVAPSTGLTAEEERELKARFAKTFVPAPTDPDVAAKPCPICKESFKSVYNEDEEEWVWYDAINVGGTVSRRPSCASVKKVVTDIPVLPQYYHASCHHSAKVLSASVKREGADGEARRSRSRSATPTAAVAKEEKPAASADPVARIKTEEGVPSSKRKIEDVEADDAGTAGAAAGAEPEAKKQALDAPDATTQ